MHDNVLRETIRSFITEAKGWWDEDEPDSEEKIIKKLTVGTKIIVNGTLHRINCNFEFTVKEVLTTPRPPGVYWVIEGKLPNGTVEEATLGIVRDRTLTYLGPFNVMLGPSYNYSDIYDATVEILK